MRSALLKTTTINERGSYLRCTLMYHIVCLYLTWPFLYNLGSLKLDHWKFIGAQYRNLHPFTEADYVTIKHVFIQETLQQRPLYCLTLIIRT